MNGNALRQVNANTFADVFGIIRYCLQNTIEIIYQIKGHFCACLGLNEI